MGWAGEHMDNALEWQGNGEGKWCEKVVCHVCRKGSGKLRM